MVLFIVEQMILLYLTPPPTHQPSGVLFFIIILFLHTCQCFSSDVWHICLLLKYLQKDGNF